MNVNFDYRKLLPNYPTLPSWMMAPVVSLMPPVVRMMAPDVSMMAPVESMMAPVVRMKASVVRMMAPAVRMIFIIIYIAIYGNKSIYKNTFEII